MHHQQPPPPPSFVRPMCTHIQIVRSLGSFETNYVVQQIRALSYLGWLVGLTHSICSPHFDGLSVPCSPVRLHFIFCCCCHCRRRGRVLFAPPPLSIGVDTKFYQCLCLLSGYFYRLFGSLSPNQLNWTGMMRAMAIQQDCNNIR